MIQVRADGRHVGVRICQLEAIVMSDRQSYISLDPLTGTVNDMHMIRTGHQCESY